MGRETGRHVNGAQKKPPPISLCARAKSRASFIPYPGPSSPLPSLFLHALRTSFTPKEQEHPNPRLTSLCAALSAPPARLCPFGTNNLEGIKTQVQTGFETPLSPPSDSEDCNGSPKNGTSPFSKRKGGKEERKKRPHPMNLKIGYLRPNDALFWFMRHSPCGRIGYVSGGRKWCLNMSKKNRSRPQPGHRAARTKILELRKIAMVHVGWR